jgi:hypothetical protein
MRKKNPSVLHQPAYLLGYAYVKATPACICTSVNTSGVRPVTETDSENFYTAGS